MRIRADFSQRAIVTPEDYQWVASPQPGVERMMLDRVGAEKARATSIVRYSPDAEFPFHHHPGGEEILVLAGVFSEGERHYPAGSYLRSAPGTSHQPYSQEGATLFVKLWQMAPEESGSWRIDTSQPQGWQSCPGGEVHPLVNVGPEAVCLQRWRAHEVVVANLAGGREVLVLAGSVCLDGAEYPTGSWLRLPPNDLAALQAGPGGVTLYIKTGHLAQLPTALAAWA